MILLDRLSETGFYESRDFTSHPVLEKATSVWISQTLKQWD